MTPRFINTAFVHTREGLVLQGGRWEKHLPLQVRVGIVEHAGGVVLIDAGYSPEAITAPGRSWGLRTYSKLLAPQLLPEGDPVTALARLDYTPEDVKAVIVTHFHVDHVSALARFPHARLLANRQTYDQVMARGYLANLHRGIFTELLPSDMVTRLDDISSCPQIKAPLGLGAAHDLFGDASVLAVDLPGHAEGHFGLCFPDIPRPLLYAVDSQWLTRAVPDRIPGFPATIASEDHDALTKTAHRVARFAAAGGDVMLCHDPIMTGYDIDVTP